MKKSFRNLFVWNASVDLAVTVIQYTEELIARRRYGLARQLEKAGVSVPSNIAEGSGRRTLRDRRKFLDIARGSLYELYTQLEICRRAKLLDQERFEAMRGEMAKIGAGIRRML
jgi:four helix bundle protein